MARNDKPHTNAESRGVGYACDQRAEGHGSSSGCRANIRSSRCGERHILCHSHMTGSARPLLALLHHDPLFNIFCLQLLLRGSTSTTMGNLGVLRLCVLRGRAVVTLAAEGAVSGAAILIVHGIDSVCLHLAGSMSSRLTHLTHRAA